MMHLIVGYSLVALVCLVSASEKEQERMSCYECSSKSSLCRHSVYDGVYLSTRTCHTKCFLRTEGDTIYRGCFDGWQGGLVSANYNGCQIQSYLGENIEWCFCTGDIKEPCNGKSRDALARISPGKQTGQGSSRPLTPVVDVGHNDDDDDDDDEVIIDIPPGKNTVFSSGRYFVPQVLEDPIWVPETRFIKQLGKTATDQESVAVIGNTKEIVHSPDGSPSHTEDNKRVECYTCHDSHPFCKSKITKEEYLTKVPCKSSCFIRIENNKLFRGCFDGWASSKLRSDYNGCQKQRYYNKDVLWCFCDQPLCNGKALDDFDMSHVVESTVSQSGLEFEAVAEVVHEDIETSSLSHRTSNPNSKLTKNRVGQVIGMCHQAVDGVYSDPYDCRRFVHCYNGFTYRRRCPPGTAWNSISGACDTMMPREQDCP